MAIFRGASGTVLYDFQKEFHSKRFQGWYPELTIYNALMSKGFHADGQTLRTDFARWDPQSHKLVVPLQFQMKGAPSGYLGTATSKYLETAAQKPSGSVTNYDFAGFAHGLQYDPILEKLDAASGDEKTYVRFLLTSQMETFKNLLNILMIGGYYAKLIPSGVTWNTGTGQFTVDAGQSVQRLYIGLGVQGTDAVSTVIASGTLAANYYGIISAIAENADGSTTVTVQTAAEGTGSVSSVGGSGCYVLGCYSVSPWGLDDFVDATGNTVGDRARTGVYVPVSKKAADITGFYDNPAKGITDVALKVWRNTSHGVSINMAMMSQNTANWFYSKYQDRMRKYDDKVKQFGFVSSWGITENIGVFISDYIADGEMYLFDSNNMGITTLPGKFGPEYADPSESGIRVAGQLVNETALAFYYQMYMGHLGGAARIYEIGLNT